MRNTHSADADVDLTLRAAMTAQDAGSDPYLSPPVDAEQLALLCRYGQERLTTAGQVLFREGDRAYDFIVVLSGAVTMVEQEAGVVRELATLGPGRFVAELNILTGQRGHATAVVRELGSVLMIPADRLQEVIAQDQELADLIVQTALRRRQWLLQQRAGLQIIGSRSSPDARRLREFAARNRLLHVWVDLDSDPAAGVVLAQQGLGPGDAPVVVMRGGEVLRNPSNGQLARAAGFGTGAVPRKTFDVAVVGAGPAGLAGLDLSRQARKAPAWEKLGRDPYWLEASLPGVFAAGDVRSRSVKRVASAVGEGSIAIRFASERLGRRAGLAATGPAARP